jgi:hypothetical protein
MRWHIGSQCDLLLLVVVVIVFASIIDLNLHSKTIDEILVVGLQLKRGSNNSKILEIRVRWPQSTEIMIRLHPPLEIEAHTYGSLEFVLVS